MTVKWGEAGLPLIARALETKERRREWFRGTLADLVSARLSAAMEEQGVTRKELARRMGKPKKVVSALLEGRRHATLDIVADAFAALGRELEIWAVPSATLEQVAGFWNRQGRDRP